LSEKLKPFCEYGYVHPIDNSSFGLIGKKHVELLREKYPVREFTMFSGMIIPSLFKFKHIAIMPLFWKFLHVNYEQAKKMGFKKTLKESLPESETIIGADIADSDLINPVYAEILNLIDMIVVPSQWAKNAYLKSGVKTNVQIVPHGVPTSWLKPLRYGITFTPAKWVSWKTETKILFFYPHSWDRKGLDLCVKVMRKIQKIFHNTLLVVKTPHPKMLPQKWFENLNYIQITGFLTWNQLRQVYEACDILLMFSRGGAFELNALEGLFLGLPVLYGEGLAPEEYCKGYGVPVKTKDKIKFWKDNPIHIGYGKEIIIEDAVTKLKDVIENLNEYKAKAKQFPRHLWTWQAIKSKLINAFQKVWKS